jgi:hypothetical protein
VTIQKDDYYNKRDVLSNSGYKLFTRCQAQWLAWVKGEYQGEETEALVVGRYVHTALLEPEKMVEFVKENEKEVIARSGPNKGGKKAPFVEADTMVAAVRRQPFASSFLVGDVETVLEGEVGGRKWKGKTDVINVDAGRIVDLKTTEAFGTVWAPSEGERRPWHEYIWSQAALYCELARQEFGREFEFVVVGVTKQDPPDVGVFRFADLGKLSAELAKLIATAAVMEGVLSGAEAVACGRCRYCRSKKVITQAEVL